VGCFELGFWKYPSALVTKPSLRAVASRDGMLTLAIFKEHQADPITRLIKGPMSSRGTKQSG